MPHSKSVAEAGQGSLSPVLSLILELSGALLLEKIFLSSPLTPYSQEKLALSWPTAGKDLRRREPISFPERYQYPSWLLKKFQTKDY